MSTSHTIDKIALYGAPDRITDALLEALLGKGLQAIVIVDDPTDIAARPRLSAKNGDLFDATSVGHSIAGTDAVIAVLSSWQLRAGGDARGFARTYDAIIALLEGLPTARVERLMLIGDHGWLDDASELPAEKVEHLQHSLHKSPLAWTLVDAPSHRSNGSKATARDIDHTAIITLQHYACSVIDQCLLGTSVNQRIHVDSRPQAKEAP
ncbi:NADH-flavin reductase [Pseudomonas daroniae]|uniref:NADH-flavin reductase n=1 Tax=Phytopseudomonas daroniae TaxID=2487519 RepID=A0A4Q9QHR2_9GAMM|nr:MULTISPECIES: NAD(P)H-binding protein [Pseudomonas]TBU72770.1 NADH-flavin reductase [Pseudomonas daroniae]TBU77752.1 NADH-flavin reductase [Pseudomonas sp. FRB 228]TBU87714.1 NADH-flavin reductase [Pseudomonas daroniae]